MLLLLVLYFCASLTTAQHHSEGEDGTPARVFAHTRIVRSTNAVPAKNESKASAKCKEYSMLIRVDDYLSGTPAKRKICDVVRPTILDGTITNDMEFPHMARLGYGSPTEWRCAGSLISEKFILSAAHCGELPKYGPPNKVLLQHPPPTEDDAAQTIEYDVARIILHPDYKPPSLYNDIMLVELTKIVEFNAYARPICLYDQLTAISSIYGIISSWPRNFGTTKSDKTTRLEKYSTLLVRYDKCSNIYKRPVEDSVLKDGIDNRTQLCADGEGYTYACEFLSGGPLQIGNSDCLWTQVGVVSSGIQCESREPSVYTRISAYVDWIENIVWP